MVERLKADGFLVPHVDKDGVEHDAEPRTIQTPYGDRSGEVIEPWLTDQWYVDAATLAKPAIEAVRSGAIKIVPKSWEKTFFNWMENIQPWCVCRQLWWGHRIPAWFGPATSSRACQLSTERNGSAGPRFSSLKLKRRRWTSARHYHSARTAMTFRQAAISTASQMPTTASGTITTVSHLARHRRPRHLVLLRALAVRDDGLARDGREGAAAAIPTTC